jgi:hypothetical protein
MSLLVPPEFKKQVDRVSNYIDTDAIQGEREIKGLFRSPENVKYMQKSIPTILRVPQFVADNSIVQGIGSTESLEAMIYTAEVQPKHIQLIQMFAKEKYQLTRVIPELMEAYTQPYAFPYDEDWINSNPIQQLHFINRKFILETSRLIIQSPEIVIGGFENINQDTGEVEIGEYDYTAASYSDGVWKPEHLFTQSTRNRANPYWVLRRVEFSDTPDARGPGNKWKQFGDSSDTRNLYDDIDYGDAEAEYHRRYDNLTPDDILRQDTMAEHGIDDAEHMENMHTPLENAKTTRRGKFSKGAQVPFWQATVNDRPYAKTAEGLRDGGFNDRRIQKPQGYNMSTLTNRSSSQQRRVPLQKHYSGEPL